MTATTRFLELDEGKLAYDVTGEGPLLVLAPGLGDVRAAYRFLAPTLVAAGYRVATVDLRGHGESSTGWPSHSRTDVAGDLLALVRHLGGGPAVIVGASFSGGAATIAAARHPADVRAVVEIAPGTRKPAIGPRDLSPRLLRALALIGGAALLRSVPLWKRYQRLACPGPRPADFELVLTALAAKLREPGRMAAVSAMALSSPADAQEALPDVAVPALVVMGTHDPDFPDPRAEAEAVAAAMPPGRAHVAMIEGSGHYPHAQHPEAVAAAVLSFLGEQARA
ncbi:alpha/beta fold hydrolase [Streptomyces sp. WMMC897]|uniref:alpha/beta fold hydrolase n=1 Tax=Streptomyces sp. WMMC897 TaxID=3014782 RepID=UPI0022B6B6C1|nr:alpha/beta hydrolase [Streptomyces sp. WMMC897]MCZ7414516.1 alpha/beta hydrolase [Streptomyces sp. WMMC897]